jgi:uridine kinase
MQTPTKLIGIAGGSCSGKTILGDKLVARLGDELALFSFDDMYVGHAALKGKEITDWESPDLYRWDDFFDHLRDLKAGRSVTIVANESPERRTPEIVEVQTRPVVAVLGFLTLHDPKIRSLFDATVYLDVPESEIIRRRLDRATFDDPWNSVEYVTGDLIAGHRRVVLPQRELAEHVLDATLPPDRIADKMETIINQ